MTASRFRGGRQERVHRGTSYGGTRHAMARSRVCFDDNDDEKYLFCQVVPD